MVRAAKLLALWSLLWLVPAASAQDEESAPERYVADIELQTSAELLQLLRRASQLFSAGVASQEGEARVVFVLHGPVIRDLLRQNYLKNRELVNLAASLSALRVVDVKACQTWMAINDINADDLQPFVETVSFAPGELRRLTREKNYLDF